ncbi:MAG: hypothetical protein EAZ26_10285 [Runella slithyformis]|nr:MAG: hypothetical protein EAZ26_10285 [Runella slithyformis]
MILAGIVTAMGLVLPTANGKGVLKTPAALENCTVNERLATAKLVVVKATEVAVPAQATLPLTLAVVIRATWATEAAVPKTSKSNEKAVFCSNLMVKDSGCWGQRYKLTAFCVLICTFEN